MIAADSSDWQPKFSDATINQFECTNSKINSNKTIVSQKDLFWDSGAERNNNLDMTELCSYDIIYFSTAIFLYNIIIWNKYGSSKKYLYIHL